MVLRNWRGMARAILTEPLLHFAVIGAVLFTVFSLRNDAPSADSAEVAVDRGRIQWLADTFAVQFGHRPSRAELKTMVEAFVIEEISYREALALGLDQDDTIIRRRLIQKYDFLKLDEQPSMPSDEELRRFYEASRANYAAPALLDLCQVYVVAVPDRSEAMTRVRELAAALEAGKMQPEAAGDPLEVPPCLERADGDALRRLFGSFFAKTVLTLPTGKWVAPVESGYGFHAVRVSQRRSGEPVSLESNRETVLADWRRKTAGQLRAERMKRLQARYDINIDDAALADIAARQ